MECASSLQVLRSASISSMVESLREQQRRLARVAVFQAFEDLVLEHRSLDFPISEVATRSGVSHRTIYNHFGDREGLIDAWSSWIDERLNDHGGPDVPLDLRELPDVVPARFAAFDRLGEIVDIVTTVLADRPPSTARTERSQQLLDRVRTAAPHLDDRQALAATAALRQLMSLRTRHELRHEFGLTTVEAAAMVSWALRHLIDGLDEVPDLSALE